MSEIITDGNERVVRLFGSLERSKHSVNHVANFVN